MTMIVILALVAAGAEPDPAAQALAAGIEQRIDGYANIKIDFNVTMHCRASPDATRGYTSTLLADGEDVEAKDVFKLMSSNRADSSVRWRYWERSTRGADGRWVRRRFIGFNGRERREFLWKPTGEGRWHQGNITPFDDSSAYNMNMLENVMLSDINGLPQRFDPTHSMSHAVDTHLRVVGRKKFHGKEVYSLDGRNERYAMRCQVDVLGAPDFLVVRSETTDEKTGVVDLSMEVGSLRDFEGRAYPSAGVYRRRAAGENPEVNYEFTVTSIERLPERARDDWFPDFPSGTGVRNQVDNKDFSVPHDPREVEKERLVQLGSLPTNSVWKRRLFFLIVNVCGVVLLFFVVRRQRKKVRANG